MADAVDEPVKVTAEQLGLHVGDQFEGQLDFDLGNLTAYDPSPVDAEEFAKNPDAACLAAASKVTQALIAKLFALPSEAADVGRVAQLPAPTTALPRAKALPKPREPTKWEKFAAQKGITKRKRSREVWDEDTKEYKRRFGYNSIKDDAPAVIEAKASDQVGEDPFGEQRAEKKARTSAQEGRQLKNKKASDKIHGKPVLPPTLNLAASLPEHGNKGAPTKRREFKSDIKSASHQAGISTASMGKFDERLPNEKEGDRQLGTKRRQFLPVADSKGSERSTAAALADSIVRSRADDILDVGHAIGKIETERRQKKHKTNVEGQDRHEGVQFRSKSGGVRKPSRGGQTGRGRGREGSSPGGRFDKAGRGGRGGSRGGGGSSRGGSSARGARGASSARGGRGGSRGRR